MVTVPQETRTERVVVLMTPEEKQRIVNAARQADLSAAEYVRRSTERDSSLDDLDEDFLNMMVKMVNESNVRMKASLDRLDNYIANRPEVDEEAIRKRTIAELEAQDIDWDRFRTAIGASA